jgi:hemerythrin superfamily protein
MPNALEVLVDDHRMVAELFDTFVRTGDDQTAFTICDELTVHTRVEEELVYPELRRLDAGLAEEAEREHARAKQIIERMCRSTGVELIDLVDELRQVVEHHVSEEEMKAFPHLEQLGDERLEQLGGRIVQEKVRAGVK